MEKLVIKKYFNIEQIKDCFKYFENYSYPFQSYTVLKSVSNLRYRLKNIIRSKFTILSPYIFYVIYNNNNVPVMIAPLQIRPYNKKNIEVLGSDTLGANVMEYVDVIYNPTEEQVVKAAFDLLLSELKKEGFEELYFKNTPEGLSYKILKEYKNFCHVRPVECTNFNCSDWNKYLSRLSKNQRHNIKKAYNKLNRENKTFSLVTTKSKTLYNECLKVYMKRQVNKYGAGLKRFLSFKYFHYISQCALTDISVTFSFVIEKEVAAFVTGFIDPVRSNVEIVRVAINDKYQSYSPGILLIYETVKYLTENTDYKTLDFCSGDQRYKKEMGGEIYYKHNFYVKL
jgi:hypothetical protein